MRNTLLKLVMFSLILVLISPNLVMGENGDPLKTKIESLNAAIYAAMLVGDIDGALSFYTDDVIYMQNYGPMLRGKEAVRLNLLACHGIGLELKVAESVTMEVWDYGVDVVEIGTFNMSFTVPGFTDPLCDKGAYTTIWQKMGDTYRIKAQILNTETDPLVL